MSEEARKASEAQIAEAFARLDEELRGQLSSYHYAQRGDYIIGAPRELSTKAITEEKQAA